MGYSRLQPKFKLRFLSRIVDNRYFLGGLENYFQVTTWILRLIPLKYVFPFLGHPYAEGEKAVFSPILWNEISNAEGKYHVGTKPV